MNKVFFAVLVAFTLAGVVCLTARLIANGRRIASAEVRSRDAQAKVESLGAQIAEAARTAPTTEDASSAHAAIDHLSNAAAREVLDRARSLQRLFELLPEEKIPEMQLLTDKEWLSVAVDYEFTTAEEVSLALSFVRNAARYKFDSQLLQPALLQYLRESGDILPESTTELLPFFKHPIDPAILSRYELVISGSTAGLDPKSPVIKEKITGVEGPADNLAEHGLKFTRFVNAHQTKTSRIKPELMLALAQATLEFRRDNSGRDAANLDHLKPYLKNPDAAARAVAELEAAAK